MFFWEKCIYVCDSYKYLGIVFTAGGLTNIKFQTLVDQANRALICMRYKVKKIGHIPVDMYLKLFKCCILPIVTYCSYLLSVKSSTKNAAVYCEQGELPIKVHIKFEILRYWCKLIKGDKD